MPRSTSASASRPSVSRPLNKRRLLSLMSDGGIKLTVSNLQDLTCSEVQTFLEEVLHQKVRVEVGDLEGEYHLILPTEEVVAKVKRLNGCYVKHRALYVEGDYGRGRGLSSLPSPSQSYDLPSYRIYSGASRTLSRNQLPSHIVSTRDLAKGILTLEQVWAIYGEFGPLAAILYPAPSTSKGYDESGSSHHGAWFLCYETREAVHSLLDSPPLCFPTPIRFILAQIPKCIIQ